VKVCRSAMQRRPRSFTRSSRPAPPTVPNCDPSRSTIILAPALPGTLPRALTTVQSAKETPASNSSAARCITLRDTSMTGGAAYHQKSAPSQARPCHLTPSALRVCNLRHRGRTAVGRVPMAVNPYAAPSADLNTGIAADAAPPAGRGARFAANLIDQILFWIPMSIGMGVGGKGGAGIGLAIGTLLALALLIYQIVKAASTGQTLAKKWLGIKVVKQDGSPVDGVTIIVMRGLVGQVLLAVIPLYGLIDALFIFREDSRCIHHLVASTKVVQADS